MTKKAAALLLAASLAVSVCATPVFASGPINNGQHVQDTTGENVVTTTVGKQACMQLKYNVTEGYTWSIPADIDFGKDNGTVNVNQVGHGKVTVKDCTLKKGYTLKISMHGNGGQYNTDPGDFKVKTEEGATLDYTVETGTVPSLTEVTSGEKILTLAAGNDRTEVDLTFTLETQKTGTNLAEKAGEYIGYAIFLAQATK